MFFIVVKFYMSNFQRFSMLTKDWYLEYEIQRNRPGLLGDIASLFGMLGINILRMFYNLSHRHSHHSTQ